MATEHSNQAPREWTWEADVIVVGAGPTGLAAAISARDGGASVIVIDANYDAGGHAILSMANVSLGGGTSVQKKYGISDSPDLVFSDLTDWSVVQPNGYPDYRFNDRALVRAFADNCAPTFEFLLANGVRFIDKAPDNRGARSAGNSAHRETHVLWEGTGASAESPGGFTGAGLMRPLEDSARSKGVRFLFNYKMDRIYRAEGSGAREVLGIGASYTPKIMPGETVPLRSYRSEGNIESTAEAVTLRARKAVILGTGGSSSNLHFRRMFDPRLTEVYQVGGEPYSYQDASGELAALSLGASLWGLGNQVLEHGDNLRSKRALGTRYNYFVWDLNSPIFPLAKATGLGVSDWHNVILVNQMGQRFFDESRGNFPYGNHAGQIEGYRPHDYRNADRAATDRHNYNFLNAALAMNSGSKAPDYAAGPVWAIFDANAVKREGWTVSAPHVDTDGYFFEAPTLAELARKVSNPYQAGGLDPEQLETAVSRYNRFVETGVDEDFGREKPKYKIDTGPFYAAWATPLVHDTRSGLRINADSQVVDLNGEVIEGLYCGGESAGGITQHGLARCFTQGFIAGRHAARR